VSRNAFTTEATTATSVTKAKVAAFSPQLLRRRLLLKPPVAGLHPRPRTAAFAADSTTANKKPKTEASGRNSPILDTPWCNGAK
jgi:hypothetical protein